MGSYINKENAERADSIIRSMGFPDTERGPYVTELRTYVRTKVEAGLVGMSPGTWSRVSKDLNYEDRARHILAFCWAADNYSYEVECVDGPPWRIYTDVRTMKRTLNIKWRKFPAYLRDQFRSVRVKLKRRKPNPYLLKASDG